MVLRELIEHPGIYDFSEYNDNDYLNVTNNNFHENNVPNVVRGDRRMQLFNEIFPIV